MDNTNVQENPLITPLRKGYSKYIDIILSNKVIIFAFIFSLLYMNLMYILRGIFPYGDYTILRMDLYHQYGPMFSELNNRVGFGNGGFIYSWYTGLGSPFFGNYYNYLSGPISFLAMLFGNSYVTEGIAFVIMLKAAFSSAFFCYFAKKMYKCNDFFIAAFSLLYSACGYFLAYYWNVMWLDGMMLLPLIFLGINLIIKERKCMLYLISLTLLMVSNYYIASMVCMASVLYFFVAFISSYDSGKGRLVKQLGSSLLRFSISSIIAAALAAFALIPIYFVLQSSSATKGTFPNDFETYFTFLDFLSSHLACVETTIRSSGEDVLPNVYSGIITLILVPLYIFNSGITKKEKASHILFILFMYISFNCNILNYIWHGFHFPNDLPFRFSFIYSFILILMAARTFMNIKFITLKQITLSILGVFALICVVEVMPTNKITDYTNVISILILIVYSVFFILFKSTHLLNKKMISLLFVVLLELLSSTTILYGVGITRDSYVSDKGVVQALVNKLNTDDKSFYRLEIAESRTHNDPSWYCYNGISAFSSMAYEPVAKLSDKLGMDTNRINSYRYYMQTPAYNGMMSLKYLLTKTQFDDEDMYTLLFASNEYFAYENNYYLPVAFATDDAILDWDTTSNNPFIVQEDFYKKALNNNDPIFDEAVIKSIDGNNCTVSNTTLRMGSTSYTSSGSDINPTIDVVLTTKERQHLYVYISSTKIDSMTVNTENLQKDVSFSDARIIDLGMCDPDKSITLTLKAKDAESNSYTMYAYGVNTTNMKDAVEKLSSNGLQVESYDDTHIKGSINVEKDGMLYTSIPYDKGWSCYIDGVESELISIGEDALCGFYINAGIHTIEFKFVARGMTLGILISVVTLVLLIIGIFISRKIRNKVSVTFNIPDVVHTDLDNLSQEELQLYQNEIDMINDDTDDVSGE